MIIDIEQGSEDWKSLRRTKITGSDAAIILGLNPFKSAEQIFQEKIGFMTEDVPNAKMMRGTELEPIAREIFEKFSDCKMIPSVHVGIKLHEWAMCSTDGLSEDGSLLLEIKCGKKAFTQAKQGFIPDYYLAQIQHCLWLTEANQCHYMAVNPDSDGEDYILMRVKKNDKFIEEMIKKEYEFYQTMIRGKK